SQNRSRTTRGVSGRPLSTTPTTTSTSGNRCNHQLNPPGSSLRKAVTQVRQEARHANRGVLTFVLRSPDPTVKTVASEDSVAVIGALATAAGTVLHQITGVEAWEGVAALVIAVLLGYVAVILGRDTMELLIGESA